MITLHFHELINKPIKAEAAEERSTGVWSEFRLGPKGLNIRQAQSGIRVKHVKNTAYVFSLDLPYKKAKSVDPETYSPSPPPSPSPASSEVGSVSSRFWVKQW